MVDAFPRPGGRVANFDVATPVAGLIPGDVVEHGLHAWFQHYRALFGLMERAGIPKPPFAGQGVYLFNPAFGHLTIKGGPFMWLVNALRLPPALRGDRGAALKSFWELTKYLDTALANPERTDRESASQLFDRMGLPREAAEAVFAPCLYSLTSLTLDQLSALEMLRWMEAVLADPRIRCLEGGGSTAMCEPIAQHLRTRGLDLRLGVEVHRLSLGRDGRVRATLEQAPDRTGVRHVLVPGFQPAAVPDLANVDAIVCTLPWERLLAVSGADPALMQLPAWQNMQKLRNVHPLTIRIWFERDIQGAEEHYILSKGTLFDVIRPTREPARQAGIRLIDCLVEDVDLHLPELAYEREMYLSPGPVQARIVDRVLEDLERMYPGQVRSNRVLRTFLHTREGIIACRPGTWPLRAPAQVGISNFVLAGDWTAHGWGVCMEGAVRSGQLAADCLVHGRAKLVRLPTFTYLRHSIVTMFDRN